MKITVLMAGLLVVAAGCVSTPADPTVSAAAVAAPGTAVASSDATDPNIRCERMKVTGSRLGGKVCHSEAEWALIEKRADELMHDIRRQPVGFYAEGPQSTPPSRTSGSLADGL